MFLLDGKIVDHVKKPFTLKDVFEFCTGATIVPRSSETFQIEVFFSDTTPEMIPRPVANTCANAVTLPRTNCIEQMRNCWIEALSTKVEYHRI